MSCSKLQQYPFNAQNGTISCYLNSPVSKHHVSQIYFGQTRPLHSLCYAPDQILLLTRTCKVLTETESGAMHIDWY